MQTDGEWTCTSAHKSAGSKQKMYFYEGKETIALTGSLSANKQIESIKRREELAERSEKKLLAVAFGP